MNILFISRTGDSLGLAMRCKDEDYSVSMFIEDPLSSSVGDGIIDKPSFSRRLVKKSGECIASCVNSLLSETKPDLVVVDFGLGKVADYIRERKILVFGGSYWTDILSANKSYASSIFRRMGLKEWKGEKGIKVECGMWWNGIFPFFYFTCWNKEHLFLHNIGPKISSAGYIASYLPFHNRLVTDSITGIEHLLKKSHLNGCISLSLVATEDKLYAVSFTTSFLYLPSLLEIYKGSATELLMTTANSYKPAGHVSEDYILSLLLSIPPFPSPVISPTNTIIEGICPANLKHLYFLDVRKEGDNYYNANSSGKLMWISARGRNVRECRKRVMNTISNLSVDSAQYRVDVTADFTKDEDTLKMWNYLI